MTLNPCNTLCERFIARLPRVLALLFCGFTININAEPERPNIILMMTDDQGWGDVGYNGHPHLKTPHLDQMAKEGVTFTRFYSAAAMCSPTRASCYTGRSPYRIGVTHAMKGMLELEEIPITTVLKQQGYTTGHFGKWHMGTLTKVNDVKRRWGAFAKNPARYYCPPWERDVDVSFVTESKVPTWDPVKDPNHPERRYGNEFFSGPGEIVIENMEGDASRVIMDRAIPFIENAVSNDKPFLAAVWFHTPHSPVVGGEKHRAMYAEHDENTQHYYACLTAMDEQVGRLRAKLKELGVDQNTMVWFCSDNGPARQGSKRHVGSNGGLSGYKLSINEGGIRVPGLMVWPAVVKQPKTIDAPAFTSDYFPTVLDALGIPLPDDRPYDGISLMPLLTGERTTRDVPLAFLNKEGREAVWMEDRYKLFIKNNKTMLFDIVADPKESNDLSQDKPDVLNRMKAELETWKKGVMADLEKVYAKEQ